MKVLVIARVAHEINRAYCAALGDAARLAWEDAPEWQQQSVIAGVEMHLANPDATPEQSHESWLAQKIADGWIYGPIKDELTKAHPCCRPYAELPPEQKAKDYLFRGVVHALKSIPDADEVDVQALRDQIAELQTKLKLPAQPGTGAVAANVKAAVSKLAPGAIAVKYIGRRQHWTDTLYRTGLSFDSEQIRPLPGNVARQLLRHRDLFEEVALVEAGETPQDDTADLLKVGEKLKAEKDESSIEFAVIDQVNQMQDRDTLVEFAMNRFQLKLAKTKKPETMRAEIIAHINRFGIV
jgi:hypothetical protein